MKSDPSGWIVAAVVFATAYWGSFFDDNKEAKYGDASGLPVNCRAYVQASVDGYRNKIYTADDAMNGLERNCGINGQSWKDSR